MFKVKRSKTWKKINSTLLIVNGKATTQISSPHKEILTGPQRYSAIIIPPYTEKSWTTAGTYSFVVPTNVTKIKVAGCGGGAGAVTCACYNESGHPAHTASSGNGGNSSFGDFVIKGANGASGSADFTATNNWIRQGAAATPNGKVGQSWAGRQRDFDFYGSGWAVSFTMTSGEFGKGGQTHHYFDSDGTTMHAGAAGNSGAWDTKIVNVTPGSTIKVVVGAGSTAGVNYCDSDRWRYYGTNGTQGFILIAYGDGIE